MVKRNSVGYKGFTLIELMVSILVLAILSTALFSVINQGRQIGRASDATNHSNLQKAASAIEAYYYGEGSYPIQSDSGNPLEGDSGVALGTYLTNIWPEAFTYIASGGEFAIFVLKEVDGNYYKYISSEARILECSPETPNIDTVVANCTEVE